MAVKTTQQNGHTTDSSIVLDRCARDIHNVSTELQRCTARMQQITDTLLLHESRATERATALEQAQSAHDSAKAALEDAAFFLDLAAHSAKATTAYKEAECTSETATKQLLHVQNRTMDEQERSRRECETLQRELETLKSQEAELVQRMTRLVTARDRAKVDYGKELAAKFRKAFTSITQEEKAAQNALDSYKQQRAHLAEKAKAQLQEYPDLLQSILAQHVAYQDQVTELISMNLQYRKLLAALGGIIDMQNFCESINLPVNFLRIDSNVRPDWRAIDMQELERWLAGYISSKR